MCFKLQFKQEFVEQYRTEFLELEKEFIKLEQENSEFPKGKRYITFSGSEINNMLIWESDFGSMESLLKAFATIKDSKRHDELYDLQKKYIVRSHTNILAEFGD
jgi:hypothetical protein